MKSNLLFKFLKGMSGTNGFQGNSLLGSSTGFKKRNLLRPPSGMLNKRLEFLRTIDISQSEPAISTLIRSQVAAMQEEMNLLDKDRRIRQGESGLQKGYISVLRKWLREGQAGGQKEDDQSKILKQLGADSYESGFRKLWKIACSLDLAVSKITELQVVSLLIYDEMFEEIGKDSNKSSAALSQIASNGFVPASFQIAQVLLQRSKDLYAASRKISKPKDNRQETNELISQLKAQNSKLSSMLEQLSLQREQEKKKQKAVSKQTKLGSQKQSPSQSVSPKQLFKEIEDKYEQQLKYLRSEKTRAEEASIELKLKVSLLEAQIKATGETSKISSVPPPRSGSYQQALMEEMEKMKKGFQRKIAVLNEEFTGRERQLRRKESQFKAQNEKIKWQKSLLLKKFEMLPK